MGVGGQRHAPAALHPGKTRYPLYRTNTVGGVEMARGIGLVPYSLSEIFHDWLFFTCLEYGKILIHGREASELEIWMRQRSCIFWQVILTRTTVIKG